MTTHNRLREQRTSFANEVARGFKRRAGIHNRAAARRFGLQSARWDVTRSAARAVRRESLGLF